VSIFAITAALQSVALDASGAALVSFTVTNTSGNAVRGVLLTEPLEPARPEWLSVLGATARDFAPAATQQVTVQLRVPSDTPAGSYSFRLDAKRETGPDEDLTKGPSVTFEVPAPERRRRFPWRRHARTR
jgi:hypothetical protein